MKKKTIIIIVVVIVVVGGFLGLRACGQNEAQLEDLQTSKAEMGSLVATVGATGTVRSHQTANLVWQVSGMVDEVLVELGEEVENGDVLAMLEQTSLPQNVILAEAELVSAKNALEDLMKSDEGLALAQAQKAVADARDAVHDAEIRLNGLKTPADQQDIKTAYAQVVLAADQLKRAKSLFNRYKDKPADNSKRAAAQIALDQAQSAYDATLRTYNYLTGIASDIDMAIGEADLLVAQESLAQLETDYEELLTGIDADEIAAAEARVAAAEATLKLVVIEAPFDGTITMAETMAGDKVGAGTIAYRLDDLSRMLVDVEISEVDINRIEEGQEVMVTFDAILAQEFKGVVIGVAPVGISQQGIVSFKVTVELEDADEQVKPGMTAAVNIVVTQLENVLLVPNRAVRVVDGKRVVYIIENGSIVRVEITLGASSDTYSEVIDSNLKIGDQIVLNPSANIEDNGFSGPFGGRMGDHP